MQRLSLASLLVYLLLAYTTAATPWNYNDHWARKHHRHHHKKHTSSPSLKPTSLAPSSTLYLSSASGAFPTASGLRTAVTGNTAAGTGTAYSRSARPTGKWNSTSAYYQTTAIAPSAVTGTPPKLASTATTSAAAGTPYAGFLRGVNIGGWLLLDSTLNANLLSAVQAVDEWTFDSLPGAADALASHWSTYFTEADVKQLSTYGVNAIKIPIGYWAYDNTGTPYLKGADDYLEKAVGWAQAAGIKVWIDVSNTDTTSSNAAVAEISPDQAASHSLSILTTIAKKYGSTQYADTVVAIELFSAPLGTPAPTASTIFAQQAFSAVKSAAANPNLQVIVPDASDNPSSWITPAQSITPTKGLFAVSESMSQLTCPCEQEMTQAQHIQAACQRGIALAGINHSDLSIYVGDFSPMTNATMQVEGWTSDVVTDVRKYVEAQLEVFEAYTSGYFFWSWAVDSEEVAGVGWSFQDGIAKGYIPNPLNDPNARKYPGQCDA